MKPKILTIVFLFLLFQDLKAGPEKSGLNIYQFDYAQYKEGLNFGLVFSGPQFNYNHYWIRNYENYEIDYDCKIGAGTLFSKGIAALAFNVVPFRVQAMRKLGNRFLLGLNFAPEYNYQYYPDLQSGFDYWLSSISLGLSARYLFTIKNSDFTARLNTSLIGLVSRTEEGRNPYYFDIGFKHAVKHLNQDFQFSHPGEFNRTDFELDCFPDKNGRFGVGYAFAYSGYNNSPDLKIMSHSLKLIVKPRNKQKK